MTHFGEIVTCDHLVAERDDAMSMEGYSYGVLFYDIYSQFIGAFPTLSKTSIETLNSLRAFKGNDSIE